MTSADVDFGSSDIFIRIAYIQNEIIYKSVTTIFSILKIRKNRAPKSKKKILHLER